MSSILSEIPSALTNPKARFFDPQVATALECLKGNIHKELDSLASSSGFQPRAIGNSSSILVDHCAVLGVLRHFSELYNIGKPFIRVKSGF